VAVILIATAAFIFTGISETPSLGPGQTVVTEDVLFALEGTGFIVQTIDSNSPTQSADLIRTEILSHLPTGYDANVTVSSYTTITDDCASQKTFSACFPDENRIRGSSGGVPTGETVSGKKFFLKKQPPADCNISYIEFASFPDYSYTNWIPKAKPQGIMFSDTIYFAEDSNVIFDVNTTPSNQVVCDQNISIGLSIENPSSNRKAVDIALVADRSGSMDECAVAGGTEIFSDTGSLGGGTRVCTSWILYPFWCQPDGYEYTNWIKLGEFEISGTSAFDVFLDWSGTAGSNFPLLSLNSPTDQNYYSYNDGATDPIKSNGGCVNNSSTNNENIYLAMSTALSENGTWEIWGWNDNPSIDYTLSVKTISAPITKMQALKSAGSDFLTNAMWLDQDYTSLISFDGNVSVNQTLTSNESLVDSALQAIVSDGATAIGDGIDAANTELQTDPIGHGRENTIKFQVLLSDGETNTGMDSGTAANDSLDLGITIFTVGFGNDVDETELINIADITGGEYYYASDENALQTIYDLIAQRINELANDSNVYVPVISGAIIADLGGGAIQDGNIIFDAGTISPENPWSVNYILNFPCNDTLVCGADAFTFPGPGTVFTYTDADGNFHSIDFNATVTLDFKSRDLEVDITSGELVGKNDVVLDVVVTNIGELDANATEIRFRHNDTEGEFLSEYAVSELCSQETPGCTEYSQTFSNLPIAREGIIYSLLDENALLSECPLGNTDAVYCYGGPEVQVYTVEYTIWRPE